MGGDATGTVTVRSLLPSVFLPTVVYEIGNGAVVPILALTALQLGASPAGAGIIVALLGLGRLAGNVPAAALVNRIGDRWAMVTAAGLTAVTLLASFFATHLLVLAAATALAGASSATFYLARQSFVTIVVPAQVRARAMSTLGGSHRIGLFIGPFVGAAVIHATHLRAAFLVGVAMTAVTVVLLLAIPEPAHAAAFARRPPETASMASVWREHGRLLLTLGTAVFAIGSVRAAYPTVVPLWADHIGLDAQTSSLIFGLGNAVDMLLFYPGGRMMDRFGRLAVALPSMVLLGGAMMLVPLSSSLAGLAALAIVMGFGNGIGSGIVLTLGADVTPRDSTVRFLSQWRFMSDSGAGAGPLIVSALAVLSLAAGIAAAGAVGLLAAAGLARWAPRYSPFATAAMVRARRT